jgi:plastocyanin
MTIRSGIAALSCVGLLTCFSLLAQAGPGPTHKTHTVLIKGFKFVPDSLTVASGDKIIWTNKDIVPHTATGQGFDSKSLDEGKSWSFVTKKKGTFHYVCSFHPTMKATLIVK